MHDAPSAAQPGQHPSSPPLSDAVGRPPLSRRVRIMAGLLLLLILTGVNLAIGSGKLRVEEVVSGSMEPTLLIGDRLLLDANALIERYSIVVLTDPQDAGDKLVKRIIGLPGDEIRLRSGALYINGEQEVSPNIPDNLINFDDTRVKVGAGQYFVLGDNRNNSFDSLNFGPVPTENVLGEVNLIIWPPQRWGRPQALH